MTYSIAVIGSGMAGLAAAYRARRAGHDVTVFEACDSHGMDAHALTVDGGQVDVPLRVMSPDAWPSVLQLAKEVGVGTFEVRTHASCSWTNRHTWFRSGEVPVLGWPFIGSWRYLDVRALQMGQGIWQLGRLTRKLERGNSDATLAEVLEHHDFDRLFWRGLVYPFLPPSAPAMKNTSSTGRRRSCSRCSTAFSMAPNSTASRVVPRHWFRGWPKACLCFLEALWHRSKKTTQG